MATRHGIWHLQADILGLPGRLMREGLRSLISPALLVFAVLLLNGVARADGTDWWTYDDPTVIATKVNFVKSRGLGGVMSWPLDGDDAQGTLMAAMGKTNDGVAPVPAPTPTSIPAPSPSGVPTLAQVDAYEASLTSDAKFAAIKAVSRTLDNAAVETINIGLGSNPDNVKRVERLLPQTKWNEYFPMRKAAYTYRFFLQAVGKFPAVCQDYTDGRNADAICSKSMATMFAHFAQETGAHDRNNVIPEWKQSLVHLSEMGCTETGPGCGYNAECDTSTWQGQTYVCGTNPDGSFKKYFGRGAKQLSYNYNYGPFSAAMFNGDKSVLLKNPELVANTWLNLASALFFYVYPQPPKPAMLQVIDGSWVPNAADTAAGLTASFGATTMIINGGVECSSGSETPQSLNRQSYYKSFAAAMGVPVPANEKLNCATTQPFNNSGSGSVPIYWDKNWGYQQDYKCALVTYQTPYSALTKGDYKACVEKNWNVVIK